MQPCQRHLFSVLIVLKIKVGCSRRSGACWQMERSFHHLFVSIFTSDVLDVDHLLQQWEDGLPHKHLPVRRLLDCGDGAWTRSEVSGRRAHKHLCSVSERQMKKCGMFLPPGFYFHLLVEFHKAAVKGAFVRGTTQCGQGQLSHQLLLWRAVSN